MRSIWTGSIAFGLVNVPVKAYGATDDHDVSLHQVHDADGGRIRYQRRCEACGKKVDYENIDKAYDDGERTVVLTDEDMESLPAGKSREIEVVQFVPNEQIDPIMLERSYYLEPDLKSPKAYGLLVETLENTELTAVVKLALRQKTRLGALRVRENVLVLQGILWGDEVREASFAADSKKSTISAQELKMASALVDQFRSDFNPDEFEDEYQLELRTLIDEKIKQGDSVGTEATFGDEQAAGKDAGNNVIDLMEALKRSIDKKHAGNTKHAAKKTTEKPAVKSEAVADDTAKSGNSRTKEKIKKPKAKKPAAKSNATSKPKSTKNRPAAQPDRATSERQKKPESMKDGIKYRVGFEPGSHSAAVSAVHDAQHLPGIDVHHGRHPRLIAGPFIALLVLKPPHGTVPMLVDPQPCGRQHIHGPQRHSGNATTTVLTSPKRALNATSDEARPESMTASLGFPSAG